MAKTIIEEIAEQFPDYNRLRNFEAEHRSILVRYNVHSFEELDSFLAANPEQESDILPDLQRLDFLASRLNQLKNLFGQLQGDAHLNRQEHLLKIKEIGRLFKELRRNT